MTYFKVLISDYEHSGDLEHAKIELLKHFPKVENVNAYEEIDREAEADYEAEYGEIDEHIYNGYIEFDAPERYIDKKILYSII